MRIDNLIASSLSHKSNFITKDNASYRVKLNKDSTFTVFTNSELSEGTLFTMTRSGINRYLIEPNSIYKYFIGSNSYYDSNEMMYCIKNSTDSSVKRLWKYIALSNPK